MDIAMDRHEARRRIFYVLIGAIIFASLVAIIGVLVGSLGTTGGKALGTAGVVVIYGILGLASTVGESERRVSRLISLNAVLAALGVLSAAAIIWINYESETLWKGQACLFVWVFATAHACILQGTRRRADSALISRTVSTTIGLVALVALFINITILTGDDRGGIFYRLMIVAIVLDIAGNMLVPLLRRAQPRPVSPSAISTERISRPQADSESGEEIATREIAPGFPTSKARFCTQCGIALLESSKFCPECGTRRSPEPALLETASQSSSPT